MAEEKIDIKKPLTESQKVFCREYIFDFNGTRAYKKAFPTVKGSTARTCASELLTNPNIKAQIKHLQEHIEELSEISKLKVLAEHKKIAFSSIAHLHNTWIERKEFDSLSDDQKSCIEEITTKTNTIFDHVEKKPCLVEYVKVKLYDKQKALDAISKMLGYDAPININQNINLNEGLTLKIGDKEIKL